MERSAIPPRVPAFALTIPGLGFCLIAEARERGQQPGRVEFDGRADVVPLLVQHPRDLAALRTAESAFVEVCVPQLVGSATDTARQVSERELTRAWATAGVARVNRQQRTFRVITRLSDERLFTRRALNDAVTRRLARMRSSWIPADPAHVEVWVLQTTRSRLRVGIRVPASHDGERRSAERHGALRPAAAAALVRLAGPPGGTLLDPCCGTGTILREARVAGWHTVGGDNDRHAVEVAIANGTGPIALLDARRLPLADDSAMAVVSNLPFGKQHLVQGSPVAWYRRTLAEAARVAPTVVVMARGTPPFRQALGRLPLDLVGKDPIVLLGQPTTIWTLRRRP